jgi:hypothetical protein
MNKEDWNKIVKIQKDIEDQRDNIIGRCDTSVSTIQLDITLPNTYGCGCERGTTKLCPRHSRC